MEKLKLAVSDKYGRLRYYPLDKKGEIIAALMRQKTFTKEQVDLVVQLGFELETTPYGLEVTK